MTSIVLLSVAMVLAAGAWLTRPLWSGHRPASAAWEEASRPGLRTHDALRLPAAATLLAAAAAFGFYSLHEAPVVAGPAGADPASTRRASMDGRSALPETPDSRTAELAERLAARLRGDAGDADGWYMLGRSYAALGRHAQALGAFREAARLRPEDASLLTEWAFSAAVIRDRGGSDDPERLVGHALAIDPRDPKALSLAGTLALDRRDYATAIAYWEQLARIEPADSTLGRQIQASIAQLRQRAAAEAAPLVLGGITPASAAPTQTRHAMAGNPGAKAARPAEISTR